MSGLPLIPHFGIDPECCGCLCEVAADTTSFVCNECGAVVSKEEAARIVTEMESTDVTCPHCGRINQIDGFSKVFAFVCRYCKAGVALEGRT
jgi:DNA-directed RNA polymerase subunit RPC12/RpoP